MLFVIRFFLGLFLFFQGLELKARPEYAAKHNFVNCNLCHLSPFGGGARNANGKLYGSHEYPINNFSKQDLFSFDTRFEGFYGKGAKTTRGLYFMTADPTVNLPLTLGDSDHVIDRFVYGLGLSPMEAAKNKEREAYFLHDFSNNNKETKFLSQILVGRFLLPFGLMTDEHRTYTRLQTRTTVFDYDIGVGFAGNPTESLHWDSSFTAGAPALGGQTPIMDDSPYTVVLNLRYKPGTHPGFFGLSALNYSSQTLSSSLEAYSIYNVVSFEKYFGKPVNWQIEFTYAKGFTNPDVNAYMGRFFIPATDTTWMETLKEAKSYGFYSLWNYELTPRWILQYKFDQLVPDNRYQADLFSRNSAGAKWFLNSNMDLNFRLEQSNSTRPGLTEAKEMPTVINAFFILLHGWI
ncbi:MAG: hypothetical protein L6Q37_05430 [Bdellovibrionaceae bacterium]|nr:hypothetical protein [Pseudobdellovibrionaceae bacterium]NUM58758.1 hypothetical protein [Pseudobdellovibrionaceae bacterium]